MTWGLLNDMLFSNSRIGLFFDRSRGCSVGVSIGRDGEEGEVSSRRCFVYEGGCGGGSFGRVRSGSGDATVGG